MMTRLWGEALRPDLNNTLRTCKNCGLVKHSRDEPENNPQHWIEFWRDGKCIDTGKTPACGPAGGTAYGSADNPIVENDL